MFQGPASHEQAVNLSDEDWAHLEREQRELYSDLLTDNEQTLQSLGNDPSGIDHSPPPHLPCSGQQALPPPRAHYVHADLGVPP